MLLTVSILNRLWTLMIVLLALSIFDSVQAFSEGLSALGLVHFHYFFYFFSIFSVIFACDSHHLICLPFCICLVSPFYDMLFSKLTLSLVYCDD
jgi:hypothetical protein